MAEAEGPPDRVSFTTSSDTTAGTGTPRVRVVVSAEVSGEWVSAEVITATVLQLADTLAAKLRGAVDG